MSRHPPLDTPGHVCASCYRGTSLIRNALQRVEGFLPPLDDEYPEVVAMLRSVIRSRGGHFVIVEVGLPLVSFVFG